MQGGRSTPSPPLPGIHDLCSDDEASVGSGRFRPRNTALALDSAQAAAVLAAALAGIRCEGPARRQGQEAFHVFQERGDWRREAEARLQLASVLLTESGLPGGDVGGEQTVDECAEHCNFAEELLEREGLPVDHALFLDVNLLRSRILERQGALEDAESALSKAKAICDRVFGLGHLRASEIFEVNAKIKVEGGMYQEAAQALGQALDLLEAAHDRGHADHSAKLDVLERKLNNVEKRLRRRSTMTREETSRQQASNSTTR